MNIIGELKKLYQSLLRGKIEDSTDLDQHALSDMLAEVDENKESVNEEVEHYRKVFREAPLGLWISAVGSRTMVLSDHWLFRPDHTGKYYRYCVFLGDEEKEFEWREVGERTIEIRMPDLWTDDDGNLSDNPEDEWEIVHYDFFQEPSDMCYVTAMSQVTEDGKRCEGFYIGVDPLELSCSAEEAEKRIPTPPSPTC